MRDSVLILKNITREGPGLIAEVLADRRLPTDIVDLSVGEPIPPLDHYGALIVLGGPASANDQTTHIVEALAGIRWWLNLKRPYFGVCLGLQLLVKAAGGRVVPSPVREFGWWNAQHAPFTVSVTNDGQGDPLLTGIESPFRVFQLHGETVELTPSMTVLGTAPEVPNQLVRVAPLAYGIQSHCELTPALLNSWLDEDPDLKTLDREAIVSEFGALREPYTLTGTRLIGNFLNLVGAAV